MSKNFLFCCESVWSTILTTEIKDLFSYGPIRALMCTLKPTGILISSFLVPRPCFVLTCFLTFLLVWTHSTSTFHVECLHLVFLDVWGFSASLSKLIQSKLSKFIQWMYKTLTSYLTEPYLLFFHQMNHFLRVTIFYTKYKMKQDQNVGMRNIGFIICFIKVIRLVMFEKGHEPLYNKTIN